MVNPSSPSERIASSTDRNVQPLPSAPEASQINLEDKMKLEKEKILKETVIQVKKRILEHDWSHVLDRPFVVSNWWLLLKPVIKLYNYFIDKIAQYNLFKGTANFDKLPSNEKIQRLTDACNYTKMWGSIHLNERYHLLKAKEILLADVIADRKEYASEELSNIYRHDNEDAGLTRTEEYVLLSACCARVSEASLQILMKSNEVKTPKQSLSYEDLEKIVFNIPNDPNHEAFANELLSRYDSQFDESIAQSLEDRLAVIKAADFKGTFNALLLQCEVLSKFESALYNYSHKNFDSYEEQAPNCWSDALPTVTSALEKAYKKAQNEARASEDFLKLSEFGFRMKKVCDLPTHYHHHFCSIQIKNLSLYEIRDCTKYNKKKSQYINESEPINDYGLKYPYKDRYGNEIYYPRYSKYYKGLKQLNWEEFLDEVSRTAWRMFYMAISVENTFSNKINFYKRFSKFIPSYDPKFIESLQKQFSNLAKKIEIGTISRPEIEDLENLKEIAPTDNHKAYAYLLLGWHYEKKHSLLDSEINYIASKDKAAITRFYLRNKNFIKALEHCENRGRASILQLIYNELEKRDCPNRKELFDFLFSQADALELTVKALTQGYSGQKPDLLRAYEAYSKAGRRDLIDKLLNDSFIYIQTARARSLQIEGEVSPKQPDEKDRKSAADSVEITAHIKLLQHTAERLDTLGNKLLGDCYFNGYLKRAITLGDDGNLDKMDAINCYRIAADQGNAEAQMLLAGAYEHGQHGLTANIDSAKRWYRAAMKQQNPDPLAFLGLARLFELELTSSKEGNLKEGLIQEKIISKMPEGKERPTIYHVLELLDTVRNIPQQSKNDVQSTAKKDLERIFNHLLSPSTTGNDEWLKAMNLSPAQKLLILGLCFEKGWGTEVDLKKAYQHFAQAGADGNGEAQQILLERKSDKRYEKLLQTG